MILPITRAEFVQNLEDACERWGEQAVMYILENAITHADNDMKGFVYPMSTSHNIPFEDEGNVSMVLAKLIED